MTESVSDLPTPPVPTQAVPPRVDRSSLNLPNIITVSRFLAACALFVMIDRTDWWITGAILFSVAAATDFVDGYLARKWNQVTAVGRILDPFVDKIIVCGTLIFLTEYSEQSGVSAWLTLIVIGREMFVTGLRSFLEQHGRDFSAQWSGKLKMATQSVTIPICLLSLSPVVSAWLGDYAAHFVMLRDVMIWLTLATTVYSGLEYIWRGIQMMNEPTPGSSSNS